MDWTTYSDASLINYIARYEAQLPQVGGEQRTRVQRRIDDAKAEQARRKPAKKAAKP